MDSGQLSTKDMWERMHTGGSYAPSVASPETKCGTFELIRVFRNHFPSSSEHRLLEMGCGGSKYLPWCARELGYKVEGIDYTEVGCAAARRNLEAAGVQGVIHCQDFLELPDRFSSGFDIVTSYGVIEHFAKPSEVLRTFATCLVPGGLVLTFVPNMRGLPGHILKRLNRPLFDTHYIFDLHEFERYHVEAGLKVVYGAYSEFLDLALLPLSRLGKVPDLVLKNLIYYANRARLFVMKRYPAFNPQSEFFCSGIVVVAAKV